VIETRVGQERESVFIWIASVTLFCDGCILPATT